MAKRKHRKTASTPLENGALSREQILQEVIRRHPPKPYPKSVEVPKYPIHPLDGETEALEREEYMRLCRVLAPRVDDIEGIRPDRTYRWINDEIGRTQLRRQIRNLLTGPDLYTIEELQGWTARQILPHLANARRLADDVLREQQKAGLREVLNLALQHKGWWQEQIRAAVVIVKQYHEDRQEDQTSLRSPFPEMLDEELAEFRMRDVEDVPWACFIIGMKLEGVFGLRGALVPQDIDRDVAALGVYIYPNVHYYANGRMAPDELNDLAIMIRAALSTHVPPPPTKIAGGHGVLSPSPGSNDNPPVTIKEFLQDYCEGELSKARLGSLKEALFEAARDERIGLPPEATGWKSGQAKRFTPASLAGQWNIYKKVLPSLPDIKN